MSFLPSSVDGRACVRARLVLGAVAVVVAFVINAVSADTVVRHDGSRLEGAVESVDARHVVVRTSNGVIQVPRAEVATIAFGAPVAPLKIEIRNVRSDDEIDVFLDDEPIVTAAREGGAWVDLTPKVKDGNNPLRLRIRNDRGTWAYRLSLRINGQVTTLSCGTPLRRDDPCTCCGKTGSELGSIELPVVWLHVDRELGRAEVLP